MTIESQFPLLITTVTGGRSALNKLRCLMVTHESDNESVSGIISLENAQCTDRSTAANGRA
jgi:hypothetical protein